MELERFLDRTDSIKDEQLRREIIARMLICDKVLTELAEQKFLEKYVTLDLTTFSFPQKEAAISFAREFPTFSDKELEALQIFLKRGDKHNV